MNQIQTADEARSIAYLWALERGLDTTRFTGLAASLFNEKGGTPLTKIMLQVHCKHFGDATNRASAIWDKYAIESWSHQTNWAMETVKHLAITNVAGIAGTAALLTRGSHFNESCLNLSILSFTLGLLMALLDFWLVSNGYWRRASDQQSRACAIRQSSTWAEYIAAESECIDKGDKGKRWFRTADYIGWISAVAAIVGGITLGFSIWGNAITTT